MSELIRWFEHAEVVEGLEQAQKLGRPVFVDLFAPGCKGCEKLDNTTYMDSQVAAVINEQFVPILYDATRKDENYVHIAGQFAHLFSPVLIARTPDGKELRRSVGYLSPEDMLLELNLSLGLFALHQRDWTTAYSVLGAAAERYSEGKLTPEVLWWKGVAAYRKSGDNAGTLEKEWRVLIDKFSDTTWAERANILSVGCAC